MRAVVEAIFVASEGGADMCRVDEAEALAGLGLRGDRYCEKRGYWSGVDECQLTLVRAEDLDEIHAVTGIRVHRGEHRRNVVVRGANFDSLLGGCFSLGGALLEYDRPRPPCAYIEALTEPGMTRALVGRGGICVRVVGSGVIRVGDSLERH
ncbi:MAG: MOSC domain-containing protein [Candidatus Binatia bacterium]